MQETVTAAEVRELLAAIIEALNPPDTGGPYPRHQELVTSRASYLTGLLRREAEVGGALDLGLDIALVREIPMRFPVRSEGGAS